ncbi:1-phosphofructokinase family hexose kinase [Devosia sp.]|uniref:1-phosphofructokinase family hexose kinase n=1 Tax=Devosia sp. TaxID=1871048 RepID=UPI002EE7B007
MSTPPILTISLNPALDITTSTEALRPARKLRCTPPHYDAGGGGTNVARAIKILGGESRAFVVLGGATGAQYRAILEGYGLDCEVWEARGETRFSLTVMEQSSGQHYRFVLPGPPREDLEIDLLLAALERKIGDGYRFVVATGSLPPGMPTDIYARLARIARDSGARFVLDTSGPALTAALAEKPYIVRFNHLEAQELVGGDDPRAAAVTLANDVIGRGAAEVAIATLVEQGAYVATAGGSFYVRPPAVTVRSAVGAGDSFVGAMVLRLAQGWRLEDACRYGAAAAASAVTTEATELCTRADTERYFAQIAPERAA